ncbi:chromate transporter [Leptotrichia shahii]|uniref:Chromate transporter n=1 Tax=Leptotrichia shahii TaxID=157691 RepID=A0A510JTQ2_9FUSO|nr:chromate transporter [Leptotrichia shahii]BBM40953.1 chromate transporter [Leptotrichia shahii]
MKVYLELFWIFFKIGAFTLGGGYAMVPIIQAEIVAKKKWIEEEEFVKLLALAQSSPGALAVNISVFVGYKMKKMLGVAVTVIASTLPSFIVILLIASLFSNIQDNVYVIKAFKAIRPMVVALIAASVYTIGKSAKINRKTLWIVILVAAMVVFLKFPPVAMIVLGAVFGNIWMIWRKNK